MIVNYILDKIWTIDNFLTKEECDSLMIFSEQIGYSEAAVSLTSGAQIMKNIRNNYSAVYSDKNLANKYWKKLRAYCPEQIDNSKAIGLNERFRFYRYEAEQRFKRHIDGRVKLNANEESRITFMIYLNDDYLGGETVFNSSIISPKTGMALCFIHEQKHEGKPIIEGEKYVLRTDVMYRS